MVFRKSIISYFLWIVYTLAALTGLWAFASLICTKAEYRAVYGLVAGVCVLLAQAAACAIFHVVKKKKYHKRGRGKRINLNIAEGIAAVLLLAASLTGNILNMQIADAGSEYYEAAAVKSDLTIAFLGDCTEFLYLKILNFVLFVFGNKISAALYFQIAVSFISLVILYFAARRFAGAVPALTLLVFMAISQAYRKMSLCITPDIFNFLIFSFGMLVASICFVNKAGKMGKNRVLYMLLCLAAGFYLGFFTGDCLIAAAIIVPAFGGIHFTNSKMTDIIFRDVCTLIGFFGGFAAYLTICASADGMGIYAKAAEWIAQTGIFNVNFEQYSWLYVAGYEAIALQIVICFGIFTFWINKKSCLSGMWLIQLILMAFAVIAGGDETYALCAAYAVMSIIAGIAVRNLTEPSEEKLSVSDDANSDVDIIDINNSLQSGTPGETVVVNVDGEDRQIKLLDNPLTLPKKKEHKAMDYDYEVSDDDDFDI